MSNKLALTIGQYSTAGRKQGNEDSYGILIPDPGLLKNKGVAMVIADGMSTSEAGKEASEMCVKSFLSDYFATPETVSVKTAAGQTIRALNQWLNAQGQNTYQSSRGMVSTMSAMVLKSNKAHIFHIGDSRISRFRGGTLEPLTTDHRARAMADKFVLTRAMGTDSHIEVDYKSVDVRAGDVFVFTTDGVHDFICRKTMSDGLQNIKFADGETCHSICRNIVNQAYDAGSTDNLTCQIVRVDELARDTEVEFLNALLALPFPPELNAGDVLDGYLIIRALHASSRSQVYLARDEESGDLVALKTPSINFNDNPDYIHCFHREQWAGRHINNTHVIKVFKNRPQPKFLYTATEYCPGISLRQWMDENPNPEINDVRDIVSQIAKGLRAFHRREMIHQDIKPDNILINQDGTVKIIDFGSVRIAGLDDDALQGGRTAFPGTIDYSAPEALLDLEIDNRADIFSLGVITYEMLTGRLPYGHGFKNKAAVKKSRYIPAMEYNDHIPVWVDGAIKKACARQRHNRYQLLSEFITDMNRPNRALLKADKAPLLEKNPVAFWRGTSVILFLVVLFLLYRLGL